VEAALLCLFIAFVINYLSISHEFKICKAFYKEEKNYEYMLKKQ